MKNNLVRLKLIYIKTENNHLTVSTWATDPRANFQRLGNKRKLFRRAFKIRDKAVSKS